MPRRLGASVPSTVSRLLKGGFLSRPPAWFEGIASTAAIRPSIIRKIQYPDSDSTASTSGTAFDESLTWKGSYRITSKSKKHLRPRPPKPQPLKGFELQEKVRRMFYKDHPFEAFRGTSLVEMDGIVSEDQKPGPKGKDWTQLRQRSINPNTEE